MLLLLSLFTLLSWKHSYKRFKNIFFDKQSKTDSSRKTYKFITYTVSNEIGNFKVNSKNSLRFSSLDFFSLKFITTQVYLTRWTWNYFNSACTCTSKILTWKNQNAGDCQFWSYEEFVSSRAWLIGKPQNYMHETTKKFPLKMPKIGQNMFENFFVHFCSYCLGNLVRLYMPLATMQSSERNTFILFPPDTKTWP